MELTETLLAEIHAYISGEMSPQQKEVFEKQLLLNPMLAQELSTQRRIKQGLKAINHKKKLQEIHQELHNSGELPQINPNIETHKIKKVLFGKPWAVAATLGLMFGGLWWYNGRQNPADDTTQLQINSYIPPADLSNITEKEDLKHLERALKLQYPPDSLLTFQQSKYPFVQQKAEWYLALSYKRSGEVQEAKAMLTKILQNPKHAYQKQAQRLLTTMTKEEKEHP